MRYAITILIALAVPVIAHAATLKVPSQHPTIQGAIDAASNGDTVLVSPGTYLENIDFIGKAITVKSEKGPNVTVIDGGNPSNPDFGSVVSFQSGESLDSIIDGFTITNGSGNTIYNNEKWGGGIFCKMSSSTISNNIIIGNTAEGAGGIDCRNSTSMIFNNQVQLNSASKYGGINIHPDSTATVSGNIISENTAINSGGGIRCGKSNALITENIICNNTCGYAGGGIFIQNSTATISNNTVFGNYAGNEGGGLHSVKSDVKVSGNLFYENSAKMFSGGIACLETTAGIMNNIVRGNDAGWGGGGIKASASKVTISNNIFYENTAYNYAGGISTDQQSIASIANNVIFSNSADVGGAMSINGDIISCTITNNSISNNKANLGGIYSYKPKPNTITIMNTILWNNNGSEIYIEGGGSPPLVSYCNIKGGYPGTGNIDADPLFTDSANSDFHLTFNSPCKDTGDNSSVTELFDFEGDPRIAYGTVDMGADEFYTHLYWMGDATPGGSVEIKFVGLPGTAPVGLCIGTGVLDPPIPSMWGDWYLAFPIIGPVNMGSITSPEGVLIIPATIPGSPPAPYSIPMQALIGGELSNLSVLEVK